MGLLKLHHAARPVWGISHQIWFTQRPTVKSPSEPNCSQLGKSVIGEKHLSAKEIAVGASQVNPVLLWETT